MLLYDILTQPKDIALDLQEAVIMGDARVRETLLVRYEYLQDECRRRGHTLDDWRDLINH